MTSEPRQAPVRSSLRAWIALVLALAVLVPCFAPVVSFLLDSRDGGIRKIRKQVEELKTGKRNSLVLISTRRTDSLLGTSRLAVASTRPACSTAPYGLHRDSGEIAPGDVNVSWSLPSPPAPLPSGEGR